MREKSDFGYQCSQRAAIEIQNRDADDGSTPIGRHANISGLQSTTAIKRDRANRSQSTRGLAIVVYGNSQWRVGSVRSDSRIS